MSKANERPFWTRSIAEQKQEIEDAGDWFLAQEEDFTDRQKLLLRDVLGYTYKGLYGMAMQDLYHLTLPESAWSDQARVDPAMVEGISRETLRRALNAVRELPAQSRPVFM